MTKSIVVVTSFALSMGLAHGATDPSDFLQLQTSDEGTGITSYSHGDHWPEGAAPTAGYSYHVPAGMVLNTDGNVHETFQGDVLAVSGTFNVNKGREYQVKTADLRLLNGAVMNCGGICMVYGQLAVEGSTQLNYMWPDGYNWVYWYSKLASENDAELTVGRTHQYSGYPKVAMPDAALKFDGDWSEFYGTLRLLKNSAVAVCNDQPIPGTVTLESGSYWTFNWPLSHHDKTQVGGLNLNDGSTVDFYFYNSLCAGFTVTNAFTHGAAKIRIRNEVNSYATGVILPKGYLETTYELIRLTGKAAEADFDLTKLVLDVPITNAANVTAKFGELPKEPHFKLITKTDGDDKLLCLKVGGTDEDDESYIHMTQKNDGYRWEGSAFNPANASWWTNGEVPGITSENNSTYIADEKLMFVYEGYHSPKIAKYDWSNVTLYAMQGTYNQATELRLKELYVPAYPNSGPYPDDRSYAMTIYSGSGAMHHFYGKIIAVSQGLANDRICLRVYNGNKQTLHGEVVGDCSEIRYLNTAYSTSGNRGYTWIYQDLTGYHGIVTLSSGHQTPETQTWYYLKDNLPLGGEFTGDSSKQWCSIQWNACYLTIEDDITISDATRGLELSGTGTLVVNEDKSLDVQVRTCWYGSWTKSGSGNFKCSADPYFYNRNYWDHKHGPQDPYNKLTVTGGTVETGSVNAFNGVAFTFADGGALAINPASTAEGMSEYGLINTRWATPFTATTTDGKIPFVFAKGYTPTAVSFTTPIATVTAAAAENLAADVFKFAGRGYQVTMSKRTNTDTTVTYVATFERQGMRVLIQ